jgi:phosphatidate cytidylyltransferase
MGQIDIDNEADKNADLIKKKNELRQRVIYAFLMMAGGLGAAFLGPPLWSLAAAFVMAVTAHEWAGVAGCDDKKRKIVTFISALCGIGFGIANPNIQLFSCLVFAAALSIASLKGGVIGIIGSTYIALCGYSFANLRMDPNWGILWIFGLFAVVWATDSSAFAIGRWLKGPKLMPIASPNKTWSGFVGGILVGTLAAGIYSILANIGLVINGDEDFNNTNLFRTFVPWIVVGFILALACQLGDLLESLAKRFFGVKDSSSLIPGHGGLLDRLDGHFAVALVLQIIVLVPEFAELLN